MSIANLNPSRPEIEVAVAAAEAAAAVIRQAFSAVRTAPTTKGLGDYVTATDHAAEAAAMAVLRQYDPTIAVLAEESGGQFATRMWVVDPLDGTTNFLRGYPAVAVSVALIEDERPVAAAISEPMQNRFWWAGAGSGAFDHRGRRLAVAAAGGRGVVATGFPFRQPGKQPRYMAAFGAALAEFEDLRRPGAAALDLAYVANGTWDGFFELGLRLWDIAAGVLLVREAGGIVSDWEGDERALMHSGDIVAGSPACHGRLLRILRAET